MYKILSKLIFPSILISLTLFLCFKNYTPDTFLLGWDSLHPEFNFPEAFHRTFFGVWRAEQGLGAVAIHSHMADIPRIIFVFLESFFLPMSFLRYSYIFLCLILGPLGVYFFLRYVLRREKEGTGVLLGAFLGALYYLLNLGTLQNFFVPFEMFTTQYAFLPWLFYFALKFLRENKKHNLIFFALITIISSPQAYAATLFYAYFGAFGLFVLLYNFKKGLILIFLTLFLNFYWLLPSIYSVVTQSNFVMNAKINLLFSPEAALRNLNYSGIADLVIHKSFLFGWRAFGFEKNQFDNLMQVWNLHLASRYVNLSFYFLAGISVLGVLISLLKRDKVGFLILAVSLYSLFFLSGNNFGLKVVEEALRMPFTKFSILFVFGMAFFFGYFASRLKGFLGVFLGLILAGGLIFSAWPMFTGNLISPIVRRNLPNEYFELFDWFKGKEGRIAALPLNSLWGWDYHSWKYEGSGFLTYGLSNPLLARDFDRWSPYNESFFNEASFSLDNALKKYRVKYLLLDESVINPGEEDIKTIPLTSENIKKVASFGFLTVYETNFDRTDTFARINSDLTYSQIDPIYSKFGNYVQDDLGASYPFVNLDPRGPVKIEVKDQVLEFTNESAKSKVILSTTGKISESFIEGRGFDGGYNCDLEKLGTVNKEKRSDFVRYSAQDGGVECDFYNYPDLVHSQGYVFRIKGKNIEGRSLKIYLQNSETKRMDLEELMPTGEFDEYFVIFPKNGKKGYILDLETRSFGTIASKNEVELIEFYPIDFDYLMTFHSDIDVQRAGVTYLDQGYQSGWIALQLPITNFHWRSQRSFTILEHKKVDSWSNGWIVPGNSKVYIFFWPQILEWGGAILGIITFGILILTSFKRKLY